MVISVENIDCTYEKRLEYAKEEGLKEGLKESHSQGLSQGHMEVISALKSGKSIQEVV